MMNDDDDGVIVVKMVIVNMMVMDGNDGDDCRAVHCIYVVH